MYIVPKDLFETLVNYAIDLRSKYGWKEDDPTVRREYEEIYANVQQAIALRNSGPTEQLNGAEQGGSKDAG